MNHHSSSKVFADNIYSVVNQERMTLADLSSLTRIDVLALTKALSVLRMEDMRLEKK